MSNDADPGFEFFSDGGVCGKLAQAVDWEKTPLGPVSSWSTSLKTTVGIVLRSRLPMFLYWGPELVQLYNDACLPTFREGRHPAAMGQRASECSRDIWTIIGPQIDDVMRHAKSIWKEDDLVPRPRNGQTRELYWTYSYSPVFEDDGTVGGVLVTYVESTGRVVEARRARTLRTLAERMIGVTGASDLPPIAMEVLRDARLDVPFAFTFEVGADGAPRLSDTTLDSDDELLPELTCAIRAHVAAVALAEASPAPHTITLPPTLLANAPWPEPVTDACVVTAPTSPGARSKATVVFGLSPRLPFDASYRRHLEQIVATIAQARVRLEVAEARVKAEIERRDLLLQAPIATVLMIGPEHVFELVNPAFVEIAGREVSGKTYLEAFPELTDTELPRILDRAYQTGEPFGTDELLIPLRRGEITEARWFKFNLQPIRDRERTVYGIMAVVVDITEAVSARLALEKLNSEREKLLTALEAANRSKDEFLAMLGHELRNPLAPITTALHLMKLKEPAALVREREIIERQAAHLIHLVDDLLDVSRVARGKVTLNKSRLALADVIARAVEMASPLFEQKRHVLTIHVPSVGLDIDGDACRLGQVFSNLLTNAAKYTETGGRISVRAERDGGFGVVRVEDNGAGISGEQLPHLFDAFFQGPRSPDRALGGLGLGLALVKSLVTLHGGTVAAESRGLGYGSVFEVRLPAFPHDAEALPAMRLEPLVPPPAHDARRVLLVDDSEDILEIVSTLLRFEGYEVMAALDGPTALQVASSFRPDVAVLDIGLPAMDGYDLAQHLREELGEKTPKLIAMTGYGQDADRERAWKAGFAAHLVKPVDPAALLASVRA